MWSSELAALVRKAWSLPALSSLDASKWTWFVGKDAMVAS